VSIGAGDPFSLPISGPCPWDRAQHSFAGWVPNVSGHLSFGLICSNRGTHTVNQRSAGTGHRIVALHTKRSAQDFPLPGGLIGKVRKSATQDYILVGRTAAARTPFILDGETKDREEPHGALVGLVLVVPPDSVRITKNRIDEFLSDIDESIEHALTYAGDPVGPAAGSIDQIPAYILHQIEEVRRDIVCHVARFVLFRTGELRIWFDDDTFLGRDTSQNPVTEHERRSTQYLPSQMYFFIKDATHRHYHHDPETDQLLKLFRVDVDLNGQNDDATWRVDTLRGLAKVVVEYRHSNHPFSNKKALGILAYADAFQSILARTSRGGALDAPLQNLTDVIPYDFNHVRTSIEALDTLNETRRGALLQLFGILVGVVLSAFALWSGAVQIQEPLCDAMKDGPAPCPKMQPNTAVDVINWVVANPLGFVMLLAVLGFLAFVVFFKGLASVPLARRTKVWVNAFSSAVAASVSAGLGGRDGWGQAVRLFIIGSLTAGSAFAAYWIVPKHEVPTVEEQRAAVKNEWSQLDSMVDKKPDESGLFTSSVINSRLRDLAGNDYDDFLVLMGNASTLQREDVLWVAGTPIVSSGRDAAYLIIDQRARKLEIGLRRSGNTTVYRSPGSLIEKPAAITKAFDGVAADMSPLAVQAPQCKGAPVGDGSRTLIFSGMLPAAEHCEYKVPLRTGQVLSYSQASARGLQMSVGAPNGKPALVTDSFTANVDGTYVVHIMWQPGVTPPEARRILREFYLRAHVQ
jgi:hypothetical protein